MSNVLFNAIITVPNDADGDEIKDLLTNGFESHDFLYSYIVRCRSDYIEVSYMISQTERYNTIDIVEAIVHIVRSIICNIKEGVICYRQPPIEMLVEIYEPLVNKLAWKQCRCWKQLEYEDLCQTCYYVIVKLYNDGYYLHKSLIEKSFNHEVLMMVAKDKNKPDTVSLSDTVRSDKDGMKSQKITIADVIADDTDELQKEATEYSEFLQMTFDEVKDILIEMLGPRVFDALFRDYAMKHTTGSTRRTMQRVKARFRDLGITMEDFINKYYG